MKRPITLILVFIPILLVCQTPSNFLAGTWKVVEKIKYFNKTNNTKELGYVDTSNEYSIEIKSNGSVIFKENLKEFDLGHYILKDNFLIRTYPNGSIDSLKVISKTKSKIILEGNYKSNVEQVRSMKPDDPEWASCIITYEFNRIQK